MDTWVCTKCGRKWHGNEICPRCEVLSTTMPLRTTSKLVTPKGTISGKFWEISDRYFLTRFFCVLALVVLLVCGVILIIPLWIIQEIITFCEKRRGT